MEQARKFVFVPSDTLHKMKERTKSLEKHSEQLKSDVKRVFPKTINKKTRKNIIPSDRQVIKYIQNLRKYLNNYQETKSPIYLPSVNNDFDKIEQLKNEFSEFRNAAIGKYAELLQFMNTKPEFREKYSSVILKPDETEFPTLNESLTLPQSKSFYQSSPIGKRSPDLFHQMDRDQSLEKRLSSDRARWGLLPHQLYLTDLRRRSIEEPIDVEIDDDDDYNMQGDEDQLPRKDLRTVNAIIERQLTKKEKTKGTRHRAPGVATKRNGEIAAQLTEKEREELFERKLRGATNVAQEEEEDIAQNGKATPSKKKRKGRKTDGQGGDGYMPRRIQRWNIFYQR